MRNNKQLKSKVGVATVAIVDGECEQWYLNMIKRNERINFKITPEIPQHKSIKDQYESVLDYLGQGYERVFWIIDFDTIIKEEREAKKGRSPMKEFLSYYCLAKSEEKIVVVMNVPCLEFWYLLHYRMTNKYYDSYEELLPDLKKFMPDYEKTSRYYTKQNDDIYLKLKPLLNNAISNASTLKEFDTENPHVGVSQMHRVFLEEIEGLKLLGDGFQVESEAPVTSKKRR